MSEEHREHTRIRMDSRVFIELESPEVDGAGRGQIARCNTLDVSSGGLQVSVERALAVGAILQIGAELYGHAGVESDAEVLSLMMETLRIAGISDVYLDLGHVGIFRALAAQAELDLDQESALFESLQRKAKPEIADLVAAFDLPPALAAMFNALADLNVGP